MPFVLAFACMLREKLIGVHQERKVHEGRENKAEMVYRYLTSQDFRQRIEIIADAFSTMQEDLNKERNVITKHWKKREQQIRQVMHATVSMYGNLQGIAGKSLKEIESLELQAITNNDI